MTTSVPRIQIMDLIQSGQGSRSQIIEDKSWLPGVAGLASGSIDAQ